MKWIYRSGITVLCIVLWVCLCFAAIGIENASAKAPYANAFSFPCLLQGTDVYLWALTSEEDGACLILQNIGDKTISAVEIVFLSYGERLVFKASGIVPGGKIRITEACNKELRQDGAVICSAFYIK